MNIEITKLYALLKQSKTNEFRLVANEIGHTELECYVHPMGEDGDTVDFNIKMYGKGAEILPNPRIAAEVSK